MPRGFSRLTRRSVIGAIIGLAFAAAAGVGLAQISTSSGPTLATTSTTTTQSQTTGTQSTATGEQGESGDDQGENENEQGETGSGSVKLTTTTGSSTSTSTSSSSTLSTTTTGAEKQGAGQEKMDVCHKTGNGGEHTINIAAPAVPAHVAHGDTVGACAGTAGKHGTTTTTTTTTPSSSSTTTTTTAAAVVTSSTKKPKKHSSTSTHGHSHSGGHVKGAKTNGHGGSSKGHG
jgi:hypothetical protein